MSLIPTWTPARATAVCTALLTVVSSGCSFIFVDAPPEQHRKLPYFSCTSSNALPTVDLVLGALIGLGSAAQISGTTTTTGTTTAVAVAVGEAALFTASAIYGYSKTSSCREANAELLSRMYRNPAMAPGFGPGFGPAPPPYQPPAYDPWLSPAPGAFAAPPAPPAAPPAGAEPTPPPAAKPPPANDEETPKKDR